MTVKVTTPKIYGGGTVLTPQQLFESEVGPNVYWRDTFGYPNGELTTVSAGEWSSIGGNSLDVVSGLVTGTGGNYVTGEPDLAVSFPSRPFFVRFGFGILFTGNPFTGPNFKIRFATNATFKTGSLGSTSARWLEIRGILDVFSDTYTLAYFTMIGDAGGEPYNENYEFTTLGVAGVAITPGVNFLEYVTMKFYESGTLDVANSHGVETSTGLGDGGIMGTYAPGLRFTSTNAAFQPFLQPIEILGPANDAGL